MGCCPSLFKRASGASSAHRKLDGARDMEAGSALDDDDDGETWDDFDAQPREAQLPLDTLPRHRSLYGLDDDMLPKAPVDELPDPFADLGMSPVIQRVSKHVVPSHLANVWSADDRPSAASSKSLFAMDTLGMDASATSGSWDVGGDALDVRELNAEARRAAHERREAARRSTGATGKGKLNATRLDKET
ncbi:hypothetical protein KFE25_008294 [Diacronema lutheri]|uniref:Uncharacterized protein n=2 Tax=Diacronema lutheri TaxID=2081491 RepID=A0A8J5XWU4_DIALT|nr:hypothetical protein KFE25_008294 [Diacronema lutheri]